MLVKDETMYLLVTIYSDNSVWTSEQKVCTKKSDVINQLDELATDGRTQVLEMNPVEGYCRDVTEDIYSDVVSPNDDGISIGMYYLDDGLIAFGGRGENDEDLYGEDQNKEHRFTSLEYGVGDYS